MIRVDFYDRGGWRLDCSESVNVEEALEDETLADLVQAVADYLEDKKYLKPYDDQDDVGQLEPDEA